MSGASHGNDVMIGFEIAQHCEGEKNLDRDDDDILGEKATTSDKTCITTRRLRELLPSISFK